MYQNNLPKWAIVCKDTFDGESRVLIYHETQEIAEAVVRQLEEHDDYKYCELSVVHDDRRYERNIPEVERSC